MVKLDLSNIKQFRRRLGMNQSQFWSRFGITQSGGSRYESGRNIPVPAAVLIQLYATEQVTDAQLEAARKAVSKIRKASGA